VRKKKNSIYIGLLIEITLSIFTLSACSTNTTTSFSTITSTGTLTSTVTVTSTMSTSPPNEVKLGQEFTLNIGQSVNVSSENLTIQFAQVISDSRCPQGVT
jgi:hypothetical protein